MFIIFACLLQMFGGNCWDLRDTKPPLSLTYFSESSLTPVTTQSGQPPFFFESPIPSILSLKTRSYFWTMVKKKKRWWLLVMDDNEKKYWKITGRYLRTENLGSVFGTVLNTSTTMGMTVTLTFPRFSIRSVIFLYL